MRRPFPLYLKILFWSFLNLAVLAAIVFAVFPVQFRPGYHWLLAGSADARVDAMTDVILAELGIRPREEWNDILERFSAAYHGQLHLFVFRNDGTPLAGAWIRLPEEVQRRLRERPGVLALPPAQHMQVFRHNTGPGPDVLSDSPPPLPQRMHPKLIVRTSHPSRYWLLVRASLNLGEPQDRLQDFRPNLARPEIEPNLPVPQRADRDGSVSPLRERRRGQLQPRDRAAAMPVTLVALSTTLSGGGLFFDVKIWLLTALGAIASSVLLWLPFVRGITRSIAQMTQATRQIAEGRFDVRVSEKRRDELGALGASINQMAARLSGFVGGQKRFLGDIAHELCAPLAKLRVALGIVDQRADDQQKKYVTTAAEKAGQMAQLINELLCFSKASLGASSLQLQPVNLHEAATRAAQQEIPEGISIQLDVPKDLQAVAEPELLVRALANLLRNAVRYAGQSGPILISATAQAGQVELRVADHGPGVPAEELPRLFDPFYRVDASRDRATGGVGLGLAIVRTCIESCQGTVSCRNREPHGLEVTVRLTAKNA